MYHYVSLCIKLCITSLVAGQSVWTPDGSGIITVARWVLEKYKSFPHNPRLGCNVQWIQAGSANTTRARNVLTQKANLPWSTSLLAVWKLWHLLARMSQGDTKIPSNHSWFQQSSHTYMFILRSISFIFSKTQIPTLQQLLLIKDTIKDILMFSFRLSVQRI